MLLNFLDEGSENFLLGLGKNRRKGPSIIFNAARNEDIGKVLLIFEDRYLQ
jgi:hypothetical protein